MKIKIDTDNNQLILSDGVNLQEFFEWCTEYLNNWRDYEIVGVKEEYIGAPGYPDTISYPEPPFLPGTKSITWKMEENDNFQISYNIFPPAAENYG